MAYFGPMKLNNSLLEEWTQIQPVDSFQKAVVSPFERGRNLIVHQRSDALAEADFTGLVQRMIRTYDGRSKIWTPLNLKRSAPFAIPDERNFESLMDWLPPEQQSAAKIILNDIETCKSVRGRKMVYLRLQWPYHTNSDIRIHYDTGNEEDWPVYKRVLVKYAGTPTREVHKDDVVKYGDHCAVVPNARTWTPDPGDVYAHRVNNGFFLTREFGLSARPPFFMRPATPPAVHYKQTPDEKPTLLLIADYGVPRHHY